MTESMKTRVMHDVVDHTEDLVLEDVVTRRVWRLVYRRLEDPVLRQTDELVSSFVRLTDII